MTARKGPTVGTEWRTTVEHNDTIVLCPSSIPMSTYSGSKGTGLPAKYFVLDECGPFPVRPGMRLVIHRDKDMKFDSFEWMDI